jgi:uncharacterized spore protein YtfJ
MKVDELLQGARDAISVRRVYGEPVEAEGVTIVPAAIVVGGGGGGGDADDNGGGGFGLMARPVGVWVICEGKCRGARRSISRFLRRFPRLRCWAD